ncbi:dipeptidase [Priestia taiwanensis]|uniref:Diguanylate cyclase n=1 Tax=Priestia taiwanensis TaxID=1347902 RepID=A0A917ENL6_9BACI|nr:dipeptidase [Priestia taiwanensis]MBM7362767.1 membrane dipeptidase [Priestia taiwanensis]GGE64914.1 diguanylate cyclase [Priestia taiwanensis]
MSIPIFDAHCDVLYKMWLKKNTSFQHSTDLHVTYEKLKKTNGKVQCMALYIPEHVRQEHRFDVCLEMIDIFYREILQKHRDIKLILCKEDIARLKKEEIGVVLTLEGCDAIGSSLVRLRTLYQLGVRAVGLTWNYGNAVADGVRESRGAGLSLFGEKVVNQHNVYRLWTDVSHLHERGFWDVMEKALYPIASHSNAYTLCKHQRNLKDEQIRALLNRDGVIGITFVPEFLNDTQKASITDVLRHIEYICSLGGEYQIGFGSDFDGITEMTEGLTSYTDYYYLIESLVKHYSYEQVKNFCYYNFIRHIPF